MSVPQLSQADALHMKRFLKYLHRGPCPYVAYTALAGYIFLIIARIIDATCSNVKVLRAMPPLFSILVFLLPLGVYIAVYRKSFSRESLRIKLPSLSHIPIALSAALTLILGGTLVTILLYGSKINASAFSLYETFPTQLQGGFGNNLYLVLVYALLPSVCEEMVYRALLCSEYQKSSVLCAVIASSLLFGMLHFDMRFLLLYVLSGAFLAITMYATKTVIVPMLLHFIYNLFCIYVRPYVISFYVNTASRALFIMISVPLFLLCAALFCLFAGRQYSKYAENGTSPSYPTALSAAQNLEAIGQTFVSLPFILCAIFFAVAVIIF